MIVISKFSNYSQTNYLLSVMIMLFVNFSFACDCVAKPQIDIKDVNDSDFIFTGVLTQFETTNNATNLRFLVSKVLKGEIDEKSINYSVKINDNHDDVFHHIGAMFKGQKWIVFSTFSQKHNDSVHTFKTSNDMSYCMPSRPIIDNDSYLSFINETFQNPNSYHKTYYKKEKAVAYGSLENKIPVGKWKYYTRTDLDFYWEGEYVNGKRDKLWIEKAINYKNENVILKEEMYQNGVLKERVEYNYIEEKQMHEVYGEKTKERIRYYHNMISSKQIYDKISNTTTIETFKNGKAISKLVKNGDVF